MGLELACYPFGGPEIGPVRVVEFDSRLTGIGVVVVQFRLGKAEMLLELESAKSAVYYAAWALDDGAREARLAVSMAKAYTGEAGYRIAARSIQIHGGIGFSWEHDLHLYFKRAKMTELTFGDGKVHRERVAQELGL